MIFKEKYKMHDDLHRLQIVERKSPSVKWGSQTAIFRSGRKTSKATSTYDCVIGTVTRGATAQQLLLKHLIKKKNKEYACSAGDLDSISGSGRPPGERSGNPLQCSCLENPMAEEPGGLQSMGSQNVIHDWAINTFTFFEVWHKKSMSSWFQNNC